ncbi:MAG TPA: PrsW family glutamic-type intramembrane protease [Clostridia bacterium]|nr:PrsW family glutamic-type intramembrane protease [Clostridia bacterium]
MTYVENIFVCLAAPLLIAMIMAGKKYYRFFLFVLAGMGACLLSAYLNTFFARLYEADLINASTQIAPLVEEVMKLLPLLFYLLIFDPESEIISGSVLTIAVSFATFENIIYLTQSGAENLVHLLIRGFATGAMHIVCGAIIASGLVYVWQRPWLKIAGTTGLLGASITFHASYNLLIAHGGVTRYIAYALPLVSLLLARMIKKLAQRLPSPGGADREAGASPGQS